METEFDATVVDQRFQIALESVRQVAFEWSIPEDRFEFIGKLDAAFSRLFKTTTQSADELSARLHPEDRPIFEDALNRTRLALASTLDAMHRLEVRFGEQESEWTWIEIQGRVAERNVDGQPVRIIGTFADIAERKRSENHLGRLTNLYAALSATNQAIVRGTSLSQLFQEICQIAVEFGGFQLAWIGLQETGESSVRPVGIYGNPQSYARTVIASTDANHPNGRGPAGNSIRTGQPSVWNDFLNMPAARPWADAARVAGFRSVAGFPIRKANETCGALLLYSEEPFFFDVPLIELLNKMSADISFALENFERESQRVRIQKRLEDSEALTSAILTTALDGILSIDQDGYIRSFNATAQRTLGFSELEVLNRHFVDVLVPLRMRTSSFWRLTDRLRHGKTQLLERRLESVALCADGSEIPIEVAIAAVKLHGQITFMIYLRDLSELKRSQQMLRESAMRFRLLVERSPEAVLVHRDGRILLANRACTALLGATTDQELLDRTLFDLIDPSDHSVHLAWVQSPHDPAGPSTPFTEQPWHRLDGRPITVEIAMTRVEMDEEPACQIVLRDVTERRIAENVQLAQNRLLNMIAVGADLSDILLVLAQFIESQCQRARCSVMIVDANATQLTQIIAPSFSLEFAQALDPLPISEAGAVCGTAAFRGEPVVVREVFADPLTKHLSDFAKSHDIQAVSSWPIMDKRGQILGTVALYYRDATEPDNHEMGLIAIATDLAGIAIESRHADDRIRYLAHYDELTGLPNRVLFKQLLDQALSKARRSGLKLATFILDLDRFKNINDTFGHAVGDQVLREVSSRFRSILRDTDKIARMGGDEFFILIEDLEQTSQAADVARRIMREASRPFLIENQECQLSASIGIAVFPDDGSNSETLLKNSDIAMYRAKSLGKDNFQFYSASKNTHTVERLTLESRLRRGIESNEFLMHYQPRVSLATGAITGAEALVRWKHPERGLIPPAQFIPIAEETGWIVPLGREILRMAFNDARQFATALGRPLRTAINLSVRQLDDTNFVRDFMALLEHSGLQPSSIELEITESMLIHNPEQAQRVVSELRELGIHFAIDDFGTGYSSLTYLKRFPVSSVKIDRSFIQDIPADANDMALTQAIIAMAHTLGLHVVAEGVETIEQAEVLRRFGCDDYQGYLFSKPEPVSIFLALLRQSLLHHAS